jgi:hypothetical protein
MLVRMTTSHSFICQSVTGKFRHLPVVENGEVVALLDITKCLYDAIARMERAAEKGNAIAAAVESVEREWDNNASGKLISFLLQKSYAMIFTLCLVLCLSSGRGCESFWLVRPFALSSSDFWFDC